MKYRIGWLYSIIFFILYSYNLNGMEQPSLYKILGVDNDATPEAIKSAYYKLSLKWHPDKNPSSEAQETFQKISQAYATLSDTDKRAQYDQYGAVGPEVQAAEIIEEQIQAQLAMVSQEDFPQQLDTFNGILETIYSNPTINESIKNEVSERLYEMAKYYFFNNQFSEAKTILLLYLDYAYLFNNETKKITFTKILEALTKNELDYLMHASPEDQLHIIPDIAHILNTHITNESLRNALLDRLYQLAQNFLNNDQLEEMQQASALGSYYAVAFNNTAQEESFNALNELFLKKQFEGSIRTLLEDAQKEKDLIKKDSLIAEVLGLIKFDIPENDSIDKLFMLFKEMITRTRDTDKKLFNKFIAYGKDYSQKWNKKKEQQEFERLEKSVQQTIQPTTAPQTTKPSLGRQFEEEQKKRKALEEQEAESRKQAKQKRLLEEQQALKKRRQRKQQQKVPIVIPPSPVKRNDQESLKKELKNLNKTLVELKNALS